MTLIQHLTGSPTQFDRVDSRQQKNSSGAYSFVVDPFERLERFCILGTSGGTYYASERELTIDAAHSVYECCALDGVRTVKIITGISQWGRAPKQGPAILALAIAAAHKDRQTADLALSAVPLICRTASTLMEFIEAVDALRGWGSGLRRTIAEWYVSHDASELAYQVLKYRHRNSWSHRDILRKTHVPDARWSPQQRALIRWVVAGRESLEGRVVESKNAAGEVIRRVEHPPVGEPPPLVAAFEELQRLGPDSEGIIRARVLIDEFRMSHEMVPDSLKKDPGIWEALLQHMPMGALIRNLGKMTNVGLIRSGNEASVQVAARLASIEAIRRSRLHPMAFLAAHSIYRTGAGARGKLAWEPAALITEILEQGFYLAFGNVTPTRKRLWLCLDISASMDGGTIAGIPGMTPAMASAALALVTLRTEPYAQTFGFAHSLKKLDLDPSWTLERVQDVFRAMPFGSTDCSLPMRVASTTSSEVDGFAVYTDSETNQSQMHPHLALEQYRNGSRIPARLAVVGMTASEFTIASPNDPGMLDIVGFDTHTPALLSDFFKGKTRELNPETAQLRED